MLFSTVLVVSGAWWLCLAEHLGPSDERLLYIGRHLVGDSAAHFDWVGSGFSLRIAEDASATSDSVNVTVDMDGDGNRFAVYLGEEQVGDFITKSNAGTQQYIVISSSGASLIGQVLSLVKISEGNFCDLPWCHDKGVSVSGIDIAGATIAAFGPPNARRVDVYGDSDTAAFGVDGSASNIVGCGLHPEKYSNFAHGWVQDMAVTLNAEVRVQSVSGIAIVKDGGIAKLARRTLRAVDSDDYDATTWVPSAVVMYVGSNDYLPSYSESDGPGEADFIDAYEATLAGVLAPFASPPPVIHICGMEAYPCQYIKAWAHHTGAVYITTGTNAGGSAAGCLGHRNVSQQATVAERIAPVVAAAAGWAPARSTPVFV